jgi:antitoxin HicB
MFKYTSDTMHDMRFRIYLQQDEDGIFVAECPTLPGCVSQGSTRDEAVMNAKDAIKGYLMSLRKHDEPIPHSIDEEVVEVDA